MWMHLRSHKYTHMAFSKDPANFHPTLVYAVANFNFKFHDALFIP